MNAEAPLDSFEADYVAIWADGLKLNDWTSMYMTLVSALVLNVTIIVPFRRQQTSFINTKMFEQALVILVILLLFAFVYEVM
jgi:hypothetical protein